RIQDSLFFNPAPLSCCHAIGKGAETVVIMGVRTDDDMNVHLTSLAAMNGVQIQPMKVGIHLQAGPSTRCFSHHGIDVEVICVAIAEQSPGRMSDDTDIRVLNGLDYSRR